MEASLNFTLIKKGLIMLCINQESLDEESGLAKRANAFGIDAKTLSKQDISAMQKGLSLEAAGGVIYPADGHLVPGELMTSLSAELRSRGVEFSYSTEVLDFVKEGSIIKAIQTDGEMLEADEFVLAAGSWSPLLAKKLGLNLPIQVGKGYSLTVPGMGYMLQVPMILLEGKVAVTPMGDDLRFAGTMEITGYDQRVNPKRISGMLKTIASYLPELPIDQFRDVAPWSGFRPCSPDGLPYIGRFRDHQNLVAATGHAMLGLSLSAVTGKLVSEVISGQMPSVELSALSPDRYNRR
jgi:D-amino-acid dehydrogenase